ncbi:MAG TPA: diacylglycerol kinase family lipid kinase [Saprospiraceae bacterium]|nr:diacylglycerol kinase family lipid kinase [Saprospiraceae bacterium]
MKIAFIINSLRKIDGQITQLIDTLARRSDVDQLDIIYTQHKEHAIQASTMLCQSHIDVIIAVGGDGTLHEVVNGIFQSDSPNVLLGAIPTGTGNDFVRNLEFQWNTQTYIDLIFSRRYRLVDVGYLTLPTEKRWFINIADVGFGGFVSRHLSKYRSGGLKGGSDYLIAILLSFIKFSKPVFSIELDGQFFKGPMMMVAVCNGKAFGNGLVINPGGKIDDGFFDVVILGDVTFLDYLKNIRNLRAGRPINHPGVSYHRCKNLTLRLESGQGWCEADGEFLGSGNAEFEILPHAVKFLHP